MDDGVNYLDDLLNEMTKEAEEDDEPLHDAPAPAPVPQAQPQPQPKTQPKSQAGVREHARPESFRGDFDYLEALLSDIAPLVESQQEPTQPAEDYTNHPPPRRPPSMAPPRATTTAAEFDLESTLRDLEDTFYNGLEGASLKRTTSVRQWPTEAHRTQEPEPDPNKRDEYMDVLAELAGMNVKENTNTTKAIKQSKEAGPPAHTTPPPTKETSVLDQMIESFAGESTDKKKTPPPSVPTSQALQREENARKVDEDISYLDQMLNSFIGSDTIAFEQPVVKPNKSKGVQVLPSGPIPSLRPVEKQEPAEAPSNGKSTLQFSLGIAPPAPRSEPEPAYEPEPAHPDASRYEPERSRVSRAPVPASASVADPAKVPALRTTTNFTPGRATLNMDDLLDQVIHSIVSEDATKGNVHAKQPNKANAAAHDEDDELVSQILGGQELNIVHIERKSQTAGRGWIVPFSEFEPLLQAKLGIGNHGEAYRPGIWRGTRVVVKRWNTSLTLTFPLQEEITTLVTLSHPNLVPVLAACGDGRGLYTLSEYVPGANLHGFLHNGGLSGEKDSTVTIIRIALQIAQAMAYLHSNGIMHRSLAPKNVLLDNTLTARVRDYGLAAVKDDVWSTQRTSNPRFPLYDSQYVAPELMRGSQYTMQVDVFSFGVLLWEAFAGESAHDGLVLRDLHGCPFSVQKLIKLCVAASPPARPTFATIVKVLSQPMETLLKYSKPAATAGVGESGFFKQDPSSRASSYAQPYSTPQVHFDTPAPKAFDEEEEDKKLQKVLYALSDLIRTPSDHAQIRAINAIESLATKEWNVGRMVVHAFVPRIIDLLHSKFAEVSETSARVVATMLKNPEFCQSFLRSNGIGALFDLLAGPDEGVRLVAAKALTVAAYTTPELTRSEVHVRNGGAALAALLRTDNEFVRVQTAWALGQLLIPGHPLLDAFFASDGVPLVCSLLITGGSPAAELRALGALVPLLSAPHTRAAVPSSIPRKIALLLSSPLPPMRSQALQAAGLLIADKSSVPILLEGHGLSVALFALIQPSPNNPLLIQTLELLRSIAEIPAHAAILVRAGLREALHPYLASVDPNVLKSANVLYNLLV